MRQLHLGKVACECFGGRHVLALNPIHAVTPQWMAKLPQEL
ncbi:MAG: hypothetical protein ABSB15_15770 [Bryobacteraceae bacterium]